jgi:mRNA-degrading endonuclease toxin of MazEF toxin-antitoxin module
VLVVSATILNQAIPTCVVVPLSRNVGKANRNFRIRITDTAIIREPGTTADLGESLALTEQIRCISRDRLDPKRSARVKPVAMAAVEAGIRFVLRMP